MAIILLHWGLILVVECNYLVSANVICLYLLDSLYSTEKKLVADIASPLALNPWSTTKNFPCRSEV